MCGEQVYAFSLVSTSMGSPPRVRGTVLLADLDGVGVGITPACAGNSSGSFGALAGTWDHPRVCGEQRRRPWKWGCLRGSPPRVRGTGDWAHFSVVVSGITPACAGNSIPRRFQLIHQRDHPRVCGEQCTKIPST